MPRTRDRPDPDRPENMSRGQRIERELETEGGTTGGTGGLHSKPKRGKRP